MSVLSVSGRDVCLLLLQLISRFSFSHLYLSSPRRGVQEVCLPLEGASALFACSWQVQEIGPNKTPIAKTLFQRTRSR
ncbi:hypothetical protein B0H63DRAFT_457086 [Podospora didyma]|uniref:Uncharacterized protein n=1 Tax=Podospora didyma TaxID=330526 RepID=A0AAE0P473_9PEZI|nr:hypothetical protein B0H63DRAFT_457086 [Podospora didyma]